MLSDLERRIWQQVWASADIDGKAPAADYVPENLDSTPASRALIAKLKARRDTV